MGVHTPPPPRCDVHRVFTGGTGVFTPTYTLLLRIYKPTVPSLYPCYDKTLYFLVLKIYIILYYYSFTYSMSVCLTLRNRTAINYLPFFTVRIYVSQDHFYFTKPSKWHINRFPPFMSKDFRMDQTIITPINKVL